MRRGWVVAALALAGCVYYNGVYNARRLSRAAEKAEREGRTLDASTYWGEVAVKAESVVARHPSSKWVPEAQALRGRALASLGQCATAIPLLEQTVNSIGDPVIRHRIRWSLADCYTSQRNYTVAADLYQQLAGQGTPEERSRARLAGARADRLSGRPELALALLEGQTGRAVTLERLLALAAAGRAAAVAPLADSLLAAHDSVVPWDSVAALLGARDPRAGSALVDRAIAALRPSPPVVARWLLADGLRLAPEDPTAGARRLREVVERDSTGATGASARLALVQLQLAAARTLTDTPAADSALSWLSGHSGLAFDANQLRATLRRVHDGAARLTADSAQGDLRLFLLGEAARDTLHAPGLAATLFRRVADLWPGSPYAPKALLAADAISPPDSGVAALPARYAASPYALAMNGQDAPGLRQLEDSLARFVAAHPAAIGGGAEPRPGRPTERDRPAEPGNRRPTVLH